MKLLFVILSIILGDMPNAVVHQDSAVTRLLEQKVNGIELKQVERNGYRVQIYSSNKQQIAKTEAMQLEKSMKEQLDSKVYVQYASPFWKVRIGDYRTLDEANAAKEDLIRRFPQLQSSTYVVRDRIIVNE